MLNVCFHYMGVEHVACGIFPRDYKPRNLKTDIIILLHRWFTMNKHLNNTNVWKRKVSRMRKGCLVLLLFRWRHDISVKLRIICIEIIILLFFILQSTSSVSFSSLRTIFSPLYVTRVTCGIAREERTFIYLKLQLRWLFGRNRDWPVPVFKKIS